MERIKTTWTKIKDATRRLNECDRGAEGLEKLLIVAAVVLPLLAVLMLFRDKISELVGGAWSDVEQDVDDFDPGSATGL